MEEREDFTMFLPSNSSMSVYPENTTAHFQTHLPREINLPGKWECALREILAPNTWANVVEEEHRVVFNSRKLSTPERPHYSVRKLPTGYYRTPSDLCAKLMQLVEHRDFRLVYDEVTRKVATFCPPNAVVRLRGSVCTMLGFNTDGSEYWVSDTPHTYGEYHADVSNGVDSLYVYSDLVEPRIVGDSNVPLLHVVPVAPQRGGVEKSLAHREYPVPVYVPVVKKSFHSVEIDIRGSTGKRIPFVGGRTTVLIHFRKAKE